jgi:hypothetical protein
VSTSWGRALRTWAAVAALVLAVSSRGDVAVLAVLLVLVRPRPATVVAVVGALVAEGWRWGATSLDAIAGAQAVLGPGGWTGTGASAASAWAATAAVLLVLPRRRLDPAAHAAVGATVALLVAGPGPGGDLWIRALAGVLAAAASYGLATAVGGHGGAHAHRRPTLGRAASLVGALAGVGAVILASVDAPRWPPSFRWGDVGEGLAVAVAAVALPLGLLALAASPRWSRGAAGPTLGGPALPRGTR